MVLLWLKFVACVAIIVGAGRQVARSGDVIAEKTGLGGMAVGVVLMAIATSLPELFTGISAVALVGAPDLTIGNLFGANTFNLLNLALLDIASRRGPLLAGVSIGNVMTAGLSLVLVAFAAAGILASQAVDVSIGWVGVYTPVIILLYLGSVFLIFSYEKRRRAENPAAVETLQYQAVSLRRAYLGYAVSALFIVGAGVWLAFVGADIAEATGLEASFVGSLVIGFTTTLPEITVSFSALRLGATDMCVANMIGSNLFNMSIIAIDDLFYVQGPILAHVSQNHVLTALVVVVMTGIFIAAVISPPRRKTRLGASWYALALIAVFILGAYCNFRMS